MFNPGPGFCHFVRLSGHWLSDKCLAIFALHGFPSFVLIFSYTSQQVSNLSATFEFRDKFLGVQSENCCLKQSLLKCKTDNWSLKRLGFSIEQWTITSQACIITGRKTLRSSSKWLNQFLKMTRLEETEGSQPAQQTISPFPILV